MRTRTRTLTTAVALVAALSLSGCGAVQDFLGSNDAERDETTGEIVEAAEVDAFQLRVGDCLNSIDLTTEVETVPTVPCSEPHDSEIYAAVDLPDGEYPGDAEVGTAADEICYEEFSTFIGVSYEESTLGYSLMHPTEQTWDMLDDREVLCYAGSEEGGLTGTLKDSKR